jgi:hypothetical protein
MLQSAAAPNQGTARAMTGNSRRKATQHRTAALGLVHVDIHAPKKDADLIRALADRLRDRPEQAQAIRSALAKVLVDTEVRTAYDIFGSELPDEAFSDVFDQPRQRSWREVDL